MQQLIQETKELVGMALTPAQIDAFGRYQKELAEWNQRVNLTAIRGAEDVRRKHFLDSLSCLLAMGGRPMGRVVDVGSGAGFPGLPLKIVHSEMQLTLVESVRKKAAFLEHITKVLELDELEILTMRAEQVGRMESQREGYDWALARAVAPLPILVEYLLPLVRVGGKILAQKGKDAKAEVERAENAIGLLGGEFEQVVAVELPGVADKRYLVVIKKVSETPEKYPRREGIPAKRPL